MREKGSIYQTAGFVQAVVDYFAAHAKPESSLLGAEMEHFLIHKDSLCSYRYDEPGGQREVLEKLNKRGWEILGEEAGNLLGLKKEGTTITLEPGGQIELSIKPCKTVSEIEVIYTGVIGEINEVLDGGQTLVSIGYHPKSKISDLPLLPKSRYHMMYDYFKDHGRFCHNMMKGTASTQVSIDYADEADFVKKYRVAAFLSPVIANLFDATPIFEGALYEKPNCRIAIWEETDIKRSKLIPGSMNKQFGFEDYAKYLLKIPPILLYSEGHLHFTGNAPLEDLIGRYPLTKSDLEHLLSMVFPDVRLKQFIEIRMADALPYPYNLSVVSLIKGIFYNEKNLNYFYELSRQYDDSWVLKQNALLTKAHEMLSEDLIKLTEDLLVKAIEVLDPKDGELLSRLAGIRAREGSVAGWLTRLYRQDTSAFLNTIAVMEGIDEN